MCSSDLLESYANVTYSLPGSFTADPCRYSVVNTTVNVSASWFNTSSYTFTPQITGYWQIIATYDIYRGSSAESDLVIQKNGTSVATMGSIGMINGLITKVVYLNGSTDSVQIINIGSAVNSRSQDQSKSWFQARLVG